MGGQPVGLGSNPMTTNGPEARMPEVKAWLSSGTPGTQNASEKWAS